MYLSRQRGRCAAPLCKYTMFAYVYTTPKLSCDPDANAGYAGTVIIFITTEGAVARPPPPQYVYPIIVLHTCEGRYAFFYFSNNQIICDHLMVES